METQTRPSTSLDDRIKELGMRIMAAQSMSEAAEMISGAMRETERIARAGEMERIIEMLRPEFPDAIRTILLRDAKETVNG